MDSSFSTVCLILNDKEVTMPRKSSTMCELERLYNLYALDCTHALAQMRPLLEAYRRLAWLTDAAPSALSAEERDQARALLAVPGAAAPMDRQALPLLLRLMRETLSQIAAYPDQGPLLHEILQACYFADDATTDEALAERLHLERSTFYQRKREAVMLFALIISR